MDSVLFGFLTIVSLVMALVFVTIAAVFVKRLGDRAPTSMSEDIGSAKTVTRKLRKREPMTSEEVAYARRVVADRSSWMAFCIPGALFMVGCFYVFGSLYHLHGANPSERTFLGAFPMLASLNFTAQLLRSKRLKGRLRNLP